MTGGREGLSGIVADYCIIKGFVREKTIMDRLGWKNTGFSVYMKSVIDFTLYKESEKEELEKLEDVE